MATNSKTTAQSRPKTMTVEAVEAAHRRNAAQLQERNRTAQETAARVKETVDKFQAALQRGDIDQTQILAADFKSANEAGLKQTRDIAQVLMALQESSKDTGIVLKNVGERNDQEQAVIDAAVAVQAAKEAELRAANDELAKAKNAWFKDRAEAAAKDAIAKAETGLAIAKEAVTTATQMAEKMKRDRLVNMSLDKSIAQLSEITQQVVALARDRIADIEGNLGAVKAGREEIAENLKQYALDAEARKAEVLEKTAAIKNLEDQHAEQQENSSEWMDLKAKIEAERSELTRLEAAHNKSFTLLNDGQRFLQMYHVQETAQREALGFHEIWIATLESGERERSILYTSHLGIVKAAGDQQMLSDVDAVATQNDEDITLLSSRHLAAMRNSTLKRGQALPGQIKRLTQISEADSMSKASFNDGMEKLARQFQELYGETAGTTNPANYMPEDSGTVTPAS